MGTASSQWEPYSHFKRPTADAQQLHGSIHDAFCVCACETHTCATWGTKTPLMAQLNTGQQLHQFQCPSLYSLITVISYNLLYDGTSQAKQRRAPTSCCRSAAGPLQPKELPRSDPLPAASPLSRGSSPGLSRSLRASHR